MQRMLLLLLLDGKRPLKLRDNFGEVSVREQGRCIKIFFPECFFPLTLRCLSTGLQASFQQNLASKTPKRGPYRDQQWGQDESEACEVSGMQNLRRHSLLRWFNCSVVPP